MAAALILVKRSSPYQHDIEDNNGMDGSVVRGLKERRSLLVEGIDQRSLEAWQPTEVEFQDSTTRKVERFLVDGMRLVPPVHLILPILG